MKHGNHNDNLTNLIAIGRYVQQHSYYYVRDISGEPLIDNYGHGVQRHPKDLAEFRHYFKVVPRNNSAFFVGGLHAN